MPLAVAIGKQIVALSAPESVTIAAGVASATGGSNYLIVDTEGGAASDELERIDGYAENAVVMVRAANSARAVIIKRGDYFKMASDFTLNSILDCAEFYCFGGDVMIQRWRSNNA
jgi:hypothetical protein